MRHRMFFLYSDSNVTNKEEETDMIIAIGAQSGCEHSTNESHRIMKNTAYCLRGGGIVC